MKKSRYEISLWKISLWKISLSNLAIQKSRYEKISLWPKNLAMKKSRYDPKISLWKNLAMDEKSRYEKISLWKNLAMEKSRYEIVLQVVYICATFANLPFLQICVCIFLLIRVSQYPLAPCFPTCLTKRASMCHALEYRICNHPGMPSSRSFAPPLRSPQQVGLGGGAKWNCEFLIKSVTSAASPDNKNWKPLIKKAASGAFPDHENCKLLIRLAAGGACPVLDNRVLNALSARKLASS